MIRKIEHIGIAVANLAAAEKVWEDILGVKSYKQEAVESEHVITSFFKVGETKIELLEATSPESAIAKHIEKRGEGMHHIAFDTTDIWGDMMRLRSEGYRLLNDAPKPGADGKVVAFFHPKDTSSVLVELCMDERDMGIW
jgi:methylmalonyl-CoA/ethylmalonyl-CoA epimerase